MSKPTVNHLQAQLPDLRIAIIGGGVGGLAAGVALKHAGFKTVTVYEQSRALQEVGSGLQVPPNASRLLARWGCLEELRGTAIAMMGTSARRYADDREIGLFNFSGVQEAYKSPLWSVHRADLLTSLRNGCQRLGVTVQTGTQVVDVDTNNSDPSKPTRICIRRRGERHSEWVEVDVVVAADGVRSPTRTAMMNKLGTSEEAEATGDAAYWLLIPRKKFLEQNDPELMKIIDEPCAIRWMGPGGHTFGYPLRNHQLYALVLLHPTRPDVTESWTSAGPRKHMDDFYASWCPRLQQLLKMVDLDVIPEFNLRIHKPLATWVDGNCALLGDACHATLPYVAQGAAQAIEDAAVLAVALSKCERRDLINPSLLVYQEVRKLRAERVVASASRVKSELHFPDGPEQVKRDELLARASKGEGVNPDLWGDHYFQRYMWGTDVMQQAIDRYDDLLVETLATKAIYPDSKPSDRVDSRPKALARL